MKPKKQTAPSVQGVVFAVLPMDEIKKLSLKEACARFAERATVTQRAFAEMGKLHHAISASLKKGQTIYGELRKVGVKDSTISNASYASKVFDLVAAGQLTEPQYDGFTFADCLAICRVMGGKSRRQLGAEEVVAVIAAKPQTFDDEFTSIFETGLTVEEAVAQAEREEKRKAVGEIQDKIDETIDDLNEVLDDLSEEDAEAVGQVAAPADDNLDTAAWNKHHEEVKALLTKAIDLRAAAKAQADLAAQQQQQQAAQNTPPVTTEGPAPAGPTTSEAPAKPETPGAETTQDLGHAGASPSDAPTGEAPAPSAEAQDAPPSNIEQMPTSPDADLDAVLGDLDAIQREVSTMSVEAQKRVFAKLKEMMAALDTAINAPALAAA